MKRSLGLLCAGSFLFSACGGAASSSTSVASSITTVDPPVDGPVLIDPSTDLDAIDRPVVLWFWSPG